MIALLRGAIRNAGGGHVVIDCNGVGYMVMVSEATMCRLPPDGIAELVIETIVRDSDISLYGFECESERALFNRLRSVRNIGPAKAIGLLSVGADRLREMLERGGGAALAKIRGIGKAMATKLVEALRVDPARRARRASAATEGPR